MAETESTEKTPAEPTKAQLSAARGFVAEHGTPTKGVVERIGSMGARVVLVGADGAMGDVVAASPESGAALIEAIDDIEAAEWDAETVNATVIGAEHRRKMAGPRARE